MVCIIKRWRLTERSLNLRKCFQIGIMCGGNGFTDYQFIRDRVIRHYYHRPEYYIGDHQETRKYQNEVFISTRYVFLRILL